VLVLVRNDDFPRTATVTKALGLALKSGGRTVIVTDADWRTILAFREFKQQHQAADYFDAWLQQPRISRVGALRQILDLGPLDLAAPTVELIPPLPLARRESLAPPKIAVASAASAPEPTPMTR
jgi:hypothetical protein